MFLDKFYAYPGALPETPCIKGLRVRPQKLMASKFFFANDRWFV